MRPWQQRIPLPIPRLAWFLGLVPLAGLPACGPAPSDHAPSLEPRASLGGPSESPTVLQNNPSTPHAPLTPEASPAPLASPLASRNEPSPDTNGEPVPLPEHLVLPEWIAQALDSPDVRVRLKALDRWAQQGPTAPLDPLVVALDDDDNQVRERAMELFERAWAAEQERGGTR